MHRARVLILSCQLGIRRGGYKNCQEYQAIRPKKVVLGNLQSEFNFYVKNHQLRKKKLANRLGGGIKRGFEVPKPSEGCSFLKPPKNHQKRLECWQFIDFGGSKVCNCCQFQESTFKNEQQSNDFGTFPGLGGSWGSSGGSWAAVWKPLCPLVCLGGGWGPPEGLPKGSRGPFLVITLQCKILSCHTSNKN